MLLRRMLLIALTIVPLAACGSMRVQDFQNNEPRLRLEDYFAGQTKAYGLFRDRFGDVRRQFVVTIHGDWDPQTRTLTLDERFRYQDGETDRRVWTIRKTGPHSYQGTAGDVPGTARGEAYGNAFTWTYQVDLEVDGSSYRVTFDDWMFLQEDGVLLNTADVTKWGFEVGTVTIAFRQVDGTDVDADAQAQVLTGE
ncbi:DUF3833 domain-containing protein [Rhodovibrio salinarum]|uniref:DUF3833 domain-containing protein n=1 Tax=Rhodovibrio salinarum TaxID=1087 RepID=A0A934QNQ0_9PROT|nr:DUF3833 domain-containing protein [Rhodovibrio salinarum]MBK1699330.1 DUF3833 domain-containing protein [Rhodovibrio salinarum]